MSQSLSSWSKENKLPKGTVHAKAKDLGIDTSNGLSDDAIAQLSKAFNLKPGPVPTETEILTGNHRVSGQLASMPQSIDLGSLRGSSEMTVFNADALATVDQALDMADQMLDAIEDDTNFQLHQLQRTQQANTKLRRKVDQLNERKQRYQTESRLIGLMQGKEAASLQQTMQELQNLGDFDD